MILILLDSAYQIPVHTDYIAFKKLKKKRRVSERDTQQDQHEISIRDKSEQIRLVPQSHTKENRKHTTACDSITCWARKHLSNSQS